MEEIKKSFNKIWFGGFFGSLIFLLIGILLLIKPEQVINVIVDIVGIAIIVLGIFAILRFIKTRKDGISFDLMYGVICIIAGTLITLNVKIVAGFLPVVLGIWMVGNNIIKIQYALTIKEQENSNWIATMVVSVLALGCGILFIFNPFKGATLITQSLGIVLCIYAIADLANSIVLRKEVKKFAKTVKNAASDVKEAVYEELEEESKPKKNSAKKKTSNSKKTKKSE